ncbi:unnamed protein product, partial [Closterium sp. NIES-53]
MADPTPAGDNPESVPATKPAALTGLDFLRRASAAPVLVSPSAPTVVFPSSGPEAPTIWTQGECSMHAGAAALPRVTAASTPAAAASTPNAAASTPDAAASTPDAAASTPAAPEPTWNRHPIAAGTTRVGPRLKMGIKVTYRQTKINWGAIQATPTSGVGNSSPEARQRKQKGKAVEWSDDYPWLVLCQTSAGFPSIKCSVCIAHGGVGTNFGAKGEGATDVQTQAMRKHQRTRKHRRALRRQRTAEAALKANRRIDDNKKVKDVEKERLLALFETALFIAKSDAPIEMYVDLVQHLAQRGTPGFPKSSYGAYYTMYRFEEITAAIATYLRARQREFIDSSPFIGLSYDESTDHVKGKHMIMEALAAKEAAKALPELGIIVAVIRAVAEDLGRSSYSNRKFKELQEVFMHTNLDVQGIHSVRWLSRGDAIARFVRVLPAIIVMLEESDKTMYHLVTLFKIHYFLFFLADVHTALNALNLLFQKRQVGLTAVHSQVRRTIIYMEQRYLNCGQQFGGGTSKLLSAFLARHASPDCREVTVEGVDKEGQPRVHKFQLHEEAVKGYTTSSGDMQGCYACCRSFARKLVYNLELRLGDLTRLNGAKLFMPRSRPRVQKRAAQAELRTFLPVLSTAPKEEQSFHAGLKAILQTNDWQTSYPNLVRLWVAVDVLPLSTVECERGFSRQNVIKSWRRTSLCNAKLGDLLAMNIWRSTRKRHPGKRKEQAAPEKERAKAKFVKGSGRRVVEEEDLDEGMCGSAGDGSESDDDASSSAGDAALARAKGAGALEARAGAVEVEVEAAGGVGVAVGVEVGVEVSVAAVEAEAVAAVAVGAEVAEAAVEEAAEAAVVAEAAEVAEAVGVEVELVAGLRRGVALVVVRASSSSAVVRPCPLSSSFPEATEIPRWGELSRVGVAIYDLDFDAILSAMYAVSISDEGDCYRCFPPDPGIETAALGACNAAALGASVSASSGTGESALSGTASASASVTFTLDSGASRSFFRDRTTLTPLIRPVAADPSGGPVLSHFSTVLPCPAAPSGTLSGLYLPSFSTNLVRGADLQDGGVHQFTPTCQRVTHCTEASTGRHLATFTRQPGTSLYTLTTPSPPVAASGRVAASGQVFAAASRSGPESAPCSCRLLSHETLLWHHRLGQPSLLRLRGMASRFLVSSLPRSLPPLPQGPGPTCVPCVEGRQRAAPHSSQFPLTEAPLQTLHMDVWGPARVSGQGHERYFLLVVDDYSRYTSVFPLRSKGDVTEVLIDWIRAARLQLRQSFGSDFPVLCLHSDRGGEFSSGLLGAYCRARGIRQTFTLPDSPQQNGIAERRIGMVMDVARTSMMHAAAPHFLWPFAVRYAAHQINLHPRVSRPETSPPLLWTGKVGDASAFRVWGSRAFVRDLSLDKLSPRAAPCVFLGFPPDAPGWQFYHPTSRRVLSSQDVTFDESVPYYRLFPYRTPSLPPPPLFLVPGPPPVDPLPPQGLAPSGGGKRGFFLPACPTVARAAPPPPPPSPPSMGMAGRGCEGVADVPQQQQLPPRLLLSLSLPHLVLGEGGGGSLEVQGEAGGDLQHQVPHPSPTSPCCGCSRGGEGICSTAPPPPLILLLPPPAAGAAVGGKGSAIPLLWMRQWGEGTCSTCTPCPPPFSSISLLLVQQVGEAMGVAGVANLLSPERLL